MKRVAEIDAFKKWRVNSIDARQKLRMPKTLSPWTSSQGGRRPCLTAVPDTHRVKDVINVVWWKIKKAHQKKNLSDDELAIDSFCNFSQDVLRLPGARSALGTFTTGCHIYSYEKDTALTGAAHLQLIGWPSTAMPAARFNDTTLRNFAGDSFSLPIATIISTAMSLNPHLDIWDMEDGA